MFDRRRRHAVALLALPVWAAALALVASPASAASSTNNNACLTSATATYGEVPVKMSGTPSAATGTVGSPVTLSGASAEGTFSAALFVAGYRLGLLNNGANPVSATITAGIEATNTTEGSASQNVPTSVTVTISDPTPANKASGDETAQPLVVNLPLTNTTWTPTGGNIEFTQGTFQVNATVGSLQIQLGPCEPSSGLTGCDAAGGNCTGFTPATAQPFATVSVGGGSSSSSSSSTSTSSTSSSTTSTTTRGSTSTTTAATPTTLGPSSSGAASYTTSCTNSVTPDVSEMVFEATARGAASGSGVSLTEQSWKLVVPASVLQTGMNLGVLRAGDRPTGTVTMTIAASGTREGNRTAPASTLSVPPIAVGADGKALPATATFTVADMSWTAAGAGTVSLAMNKAVAVVKIGPIEVSFTCTPKAPVATLASVAVQGGSAQVAGVSQTRQSSGQLARTGPSALVKIVLAVGLIDLGYLFWSATRPRRRDLR